VKSLILLLTLLLALPATAQQPILMARARLKAPEAMEILKETVQEYGYHIAHVQRCDGGMSEFHYKTDYYRVLFIGKIDEVRGILKRYPEMAPYLPLKIAVIAENDETLLSVVDPRALGHLFGHNPVLQVQFARWYNDLHAILEELRTFRK
jgi:uncharacterized protein (DUF302 family)